MLIDTLHPRDDIVAAAIRQMARDLRDYERERLGDVDAAVERHGRAAHARRSAATRPRRRPPRARARGRGRPRGLAAPRPVIWRACCSMSRSRSANRTYAPASASGSGSGSPRSTPPPALRRFTWVERGGTHIHLIPTEQPAIPRSGHAAVVVEDFDAAVAALEDGRLLARADRAGVGRAAGVRARPGRSPGRADGFTAWLADCPVSVPSISRRSGGTRAAGTIRWSRGHASALAVVLEDGVERPRGERVVAQVQPAGARVGGEAAPARRRCRRARPRPSARGSRPARAAGSSRGRRRPRSRARRRASGAGARRGRRRAAACRSSSGPAARARRAGASAIISSRSASMPAARTAAWRSARTDQNSDTVRVPRCGGTPVGSSPSSRCVPSKTWSRTPLQRPSGSGRIVHSAPQRYSRSRPGMPARSSERAPSAATTRSYGPCSFPPASVSTPPRRAAMRTPAWTGTPASASASCSAPNSTPRCTPSASRPGRRSS